MELRQDLGEKRDRGRGERNRKRAEGRMEESRGRRNGGVKEGDCRWREKER